MRNLYYIIFYFILNATNISAQWYLQESGTTADLRGVWFVDSLNGWACGDSGIVLHTSNGGQVWQRQNSNVTVKLEDVFFWDLQTGWIVGDSGTVIHTSDGGINWIKQETTINNNLRKIQFVTSLIGFASGEGNKILQTDDGGATWQVIYLEPEVNDFLFFWIDQVFGTRIVSNGIITLQSFTGDAGLTWTPPIQAGFNVNDSWGFIDNSGWIYFCDVGIKGNVLVIFIIEGFPQFYGYTPDTLDLYAITLESNVDFPKLWAVGQHGWIISSLDTGFTWQTIPSGVTTDLYEISFPLQNYGWIVGDSGTILKYENTSSVLEPSQDLLPNNIYLFEPYPNPFNNFVIIEYSINNSENISLEIYNYLGQSVKKLLNSYTDKGNYKMNWDGKNENGEVCPSGIYLIALKSKEQSISKKIILLK